MHSTVCQRGSLRCLADGPAQIDWAETLTERGAISDSNAVGPILRRVEEYCISYFLISSSASLSASFRGGGMPLAACRWLGCAARRRHLGCGGMAGARGNSAAFPAARTARRPCQPPCAGLSTAVEAHDYLVGSSLTLADIAMYSTLLPTFSKQPVSGPPWTTEQQQHMGCYCQFSDIANETSTGMTASVQEVLPPGGEEVPR